MAGRAGRPILGDEFSALSEALPAYEVVGVLGSGAFAVVYAAKHVQLHREVAIKRLSSELLDSRDARQRFAAEARMLASLDHPHIVRVHDYVESEAICALVMERTHGGSLADRMRLSRQGSSTSCAIALAALNGLEHAHQNGVLHRDVKPENLLFAASDLVKVADFGIAKVIGAQGARLTATAGTIGTPAYMAPEQVRRAAGPLSPATDVWALGAVLYELLAGEAPFPHDERTELTDLLLARVTDEPRPLREVAPEVPQPIEEVVMQALRREPGRRFQTAAAFASALEGAAEEGLGRGSVAATGVPIHRTGPAPAGTPTVVEPAEADLVPGLPQHDGRRGWLRPRTAGFAAGGLVAAGVAALALTLSGGGEKANPLAKLPGPPAGWPARMAIGYGDSVSGAGGVARRMGAGGLVHQDYGVGDAAAGKDWSQNRVVPSPGRFASAAQRRGLLPYLTYYELRLMGRDGKDDATTIQLRKTLVKHRLMQIYWRNVRAFLTELGKTNKPVAIAVEPSVWGLLEQALGFSGGSPSDIPAVVGSSGIPDLQGLSDNLTGVSDAWRRLRDRYAPKVLLGAPMDFYGANVDIGRQLPTQSTIASAARGQAQFFLTLGKTKIDFDFASWETAFIEAGTDPRSKGFSTAQKEAVVSWARQFGRVARVPLVLEDVPEGNTIMKTIDDRPYHYHDTWVQWLLGDAHFSKLRELRDAGVIGVLFGVGSGNTETCACDAAHDGVTNAGKRGIVSHSPDDDGGYLAMRAAALRRAGGLLLSKVQTSN